MMGDNCPHCGYKDDRIISLTSLADELKEKHFIELADLLQEYEVYKILELAREGRLMEKLDILKQLIG